jgi:hypothetical protein
VRHAANGGAGRTRRRHVTAGRIATTGKGMTMAHDMKHYEKVAKVYTRSGSIAKTQNHFPNYSERTIQRWVKKCREMGLLPA